MKAIKYIVQSATMIFFVFTCLGFSIWFKIIKDESLMRKFKKSGDQQAPHLAIPEHSNFTKALATIISIFNLLVLYKVACYFIK